MNRRNFLKALGIGAAALAVPKLLVTPEDEEFQQVARRYWQGTGPLGDQIKAGRGGVFSKDAIIYVKFSTIQEQDRLMALLIDMRKLPRGNRRTYADPWIGLKSGAEMTRLIFDGLVLDA